MVKYTKSKNIHPCKLNQEDLVDLVNLIKQDFQLERKEDLRIYSDLPDITISANSVNEFLNHRGVPDKLNRLSIEIVGWNASRNIDKSFRITFYDNFISLHVDGESESWVIGKYHQIVNYLITKRPFFWFLKSPSSYILQAILSVIPFMGSGIIVAKTIKEGFASVNILLPTIVVVSAFSSYVINRLPYTEIILRKERTFMEKYNTIIIIIGVLAAVVTIAQFLLYLFSFFGK